ncbi:MAG: phosphate-starvation-inducible PsiE family protein [Vulcanococcus sp.]|jgi:uncharacterized membrane protein (DUF373 family)|uniref:phosphate-starvation-inducible PsiE family protein n=1 Tax=Vulcanococcus sp. TaxID=2856995 RepID=UPI0025F489F9|nr:phosphate-starvation-inducible PsiE family protein [Vulcanococcus sp.]MBW0173478.1 phosphate-starvation-inducible PsiE family protein [Vulcanococcus sp.]MBW0180216.1 phosphate-starvation-inducible PsiE family protein [Vulcanococcus sp.]
MFDDLSFLRAITAFERALAKVLSVVLTAVLVVSALQLLIFLGSDLLDLSVNWTGEGLIRLLDQVLVILIALEVLQNLTAYMREHVVQIELVLVTALTAVARKVIVMPPGVQKNPADLIGLGAAVLSLAGAYWLVRESHFKRLPSRRERATGSLDPDQS